MKIKRYYDLWLISIDLRDWYKIKGSDMWYCGNKDCGCGDYEELMKEEKSDIMKIPLYKKIKFHRYICYGTIIPFIIGLIIGIYL